MRGAYANPLNFVNYMGEDYAPTPHYEALNILIKYIQCYFRTNINPKNSHLGLGMGNTWNFALRNIKVLASAFENARNYPMPSQMKLMVFVSKLLTPENTETKYKFKPKVGKFTNRPATDSSSANVTSSTPRISDLGKICQHWLQAVIPRILNGGHTTEKFTMFFAKNTTVPAASINQTLQLLQDIDNKIQRREQRYQHGCCHLHYKLYTVSILCSMLVLIELMLC